MASRLWCPVVNSGSGVAAQLGHQVACGARADVKAFAERLGGDRAVVELLSVGADCLLDFCLVSDETKARSKLDL